MKKWGEVALIVLGLFLVVELLSMWLGLTIYVITLLVLLVVFWVVYFRDKNDGREGEIRIFMMGAWLLYMAISYLLVTLRFTQLNTGFKIIAFACWLIFLNRINNQPPPQAPNQPPTP